MILSIAQILNALILIGLILLQERASGTSGVFGGSEGGGFYQRRRGMEKIIFISTIVMTVMFAGLSLWSLFATINF